MTDYSLKELTRLIRKSFARYDNQGTKHWTWKTMLQDLSYQVGSLQKIDLQLSNYRYSHGKSKTDLEKDFRNELANILAEVLYIADELKIDMNQAMNEMFEDDTKKVKNRTA